MARSRILLQMPLQGKNGDAGLAKEDHLKVRLLAVELGLPMYEIYAILIRVALNHRSWTKGLVEEFKATRARKKKK